MPAFRTNFLSGFPSVKAAKFLTVFGVVAVTPVGLFAALFVHDFIVHVLRGPHVIADDESAVNLVVALVQKFAIRNIGVQELSGNAVVLVTIVKAE